ncbi:MAG: SgcJ/EcaC family oxidoreductase [Dehalococcoidia bacterium]
MPAKSPEEMNDLFEKAMNSAGVEALVALYEPEGVLVASPDQVATGHDAIREALGAYLAGKPQLTMEAGPIQVVGDIALSVHGWKMKIEGPDGPSELKGTAAEVMRRQPDGTWLFVVDNPFAGE